jgi:hypothetical protein
MLHDDNDDAPTSKRSRNAHPIEDEPDAEASPDDTCGEVEYYEVRLYQPGRGRVSFKISKDQQSELIPQVSFKAMWFFCFQASCLLRSGEFNAMSPEFFGHMQASVWSHESAVVCVPVCQELQWSLLVVVGSTDSAVI